jgi:hypothetical protein
MSDLTTENVVELGDGRLVTARAKAAHDQLQAHDRELRKREGRARMWAAAAVIGILLGIVVGACAIARTATLTEAGESAQLEIDAIKQDLKTVCRAVPAGQLPDPEQDKCFRAEANLPPSSPVEQQQPAPQGLDDAALLQAVKSRVDNYLAQNPLPTAADLLPLVRQVYEENRPKDGAPGPAPTDAQLLGLIRAVYVANPPAPGADATQEQADVAIASYCAKQPGGSCRGEAGPQGEQGRPGAPGADGEPGRGIVSRAYVIEDGRCVERTTYTAAPTPQDIPVNVLLCTT